MGFRPLTPGSVETDIAKILQATPLHPNAVTHRVILHTVNDDINISELVSIETSRDYHNNISDYVLVTFNLGLGECVKRVLPQSDNLEMSIITTYYNRTYTDRYKMVIVSGPPSTAGSIYSSYTEDELNQMDKILIEAQCVNRLVEALRLLPIDDIYSYSTVKNVMKTAIMSALSNVKIENTTVDTAIDIVEPNNGKTFRHISIPTGVRLLELPSYLQTTDYGVYSTDIGTYIQRYGYFKDGIEPKDTIFIYPLYNHELVDKPGKRLMIFSSPNNVLASVENSYLEDGDIIKIIGTGDMSGIETSQHKLIDQGNSLLIGNPDSVMKKHTDVTNDTVHAKKKTAIQGDILRRKRDGHDTANYIAPLSNTYKHYSELSKNLLSPYQLTWNYSNPELLYPGMPVSYVYEDSDRGVIRLNGTLHSVFTKYSGPNKTHTSLLNVLLEPYVEGTSNSNQTVDVTY